MSQPTGEHRLLSTINAGSSSIKFALFDGDSLDCVRRGSIVRIGLPDSTFHVSGPHASDTATQEVAAPDAGAAATLLMDWISTHCGKNVLQAVRHRVVHGGPTYIEPQEITEEVLAELRTLSPFDPEHLPPEILLIESVARRFPHLQQFACFDTAFHHHMPRVAQMLPIPRRYESQGVRRYGFHGLSYAYLMEELERVAGREAARGRIILAHLGNGASLAAVREGNPVDTTMGFTPTAGVPMGTRSGDLDPGLVGYLARTEGMSAQQFHEMVNFRSGLLGVSEISSDMHDLLQQETQDIHAAEAIALFCYGVRKSIGALAAALGGLDTMVFSGGIGENSPAVRHRICESLGVLGIETDALRNSGNAPVISVDGSPVTVRVIPTNEELVIARQTRELLQSDKLSVSEETADRGVR